MMEELAGKADILRVELLYNHGWIFIDADSICTNPLDDALLNNNNFACYENEQCRKWLIANGYLWAEKWSRLMELMIKKILEIESFEWKMAWQSTGPCLLTESNRELPYNLTIYPSYYFLPKHYTWLEYKWDCKSYSEQYWGSTFNLYK
jgi:mannosyltransferase OCH1-like enzyme